VSSAEAWRRPSSGTARGCAAPPGRPAGVSSAEGLRLQHIQQRCVTRSRRILRFRRKIRRQDVTDRKAPQVGPHQGCDGPDEDKRERGANEVGTAVGPALEITAEESRLVLALVMAAYAAKPVRMRTAMENLPSTIFPSVAVQRIKELGPPEQRVEQDHLVVVE